MKNAIKSKEGFVGTTYLVKTVRMTYFTPSGKARLGTKTTYSVYADMHNGMESERSRYNFKSKAEATKYYNSVNALMSVDEQREADEWDAGYDDRLKKHARASSDI